jgi:histone H3/H4
VKITNKSNLPQAIFDAVRNDPYSSGDADASVTELLSPPRQAALKRANRERIEEDASDRIYSLLGQLIHTLLERANKTAIAERRLSITVEGWKVSGAMDALYEHGLLQDYKFVTAYKFKDGVAPEEYEQQMNIYAAILRANGERVTALEIVGILRDWSKLEAQRDPSYPQSQVVVMPVPLWPEEKATAFLRERVILHKQARASLPICTAAERWARPDRYAVMKPGAARADRVYDSKEEAEAHVAQKKGLIVEHRLGENIRCQAYCSVAKFCTQFEAITDVLKAKRAS